MATATVDVAAAPVSSGEKAFRSTSPALPGTSGVHRSTASSFDLLWLLDTEIKLTGASGAAPRWSGAVAQRARVIQTDKHFVFMPCHQL